MGVSLMAQVLFLHVWHLIHVFDVFSHSSFIFPPQGQSCGCSSVTDKQADRQWEGNKEGVSLTASSE